MKPCLHREYKLASPGTQTGPFSSIPSTSLTVSIQSWQEPISFILMKLRPPLKSMPPGCALKVELLDWDHISIWTKASGYCYSGSWNTKYIHFRRNSHSLYLMNFYHPEHIGRQSWVVHEKFGVKIERNFSKKFFP